MHKIRITFMLALLSAGILLASCQKDKNDEPTPSSSVTTDTTQVTPTPNDNPQNVDNNGDNNPQNPDNPDNGENNPPTTNSIVIKVAFEEIEGIEKPSFTTDDVAAKVAMTISEGENTLGTLVLQDANGNFSGELTTAPSEDGVNLTATIATNEGSTVISSIESIPDLIKQCAHTYKGTFRYKTDDIVALTDDKAYIEIIMSPLQHKVDVTIDDENQNFIMSNDGKVWIAIDGGAKFVTNFTDEVVSSAGKILTINRKGFVDLGISDGILWADENVSGGEGTNIDGNWYYTFEQAQAFGADNLPTSGRDITDNKSYPYTDFYNLLNQCCWDFVVDEDDNFLGYNVYKAKVDDDKGKKSDRTIITMAHYLSGLYFKGGKYDASQEPHIFLPANGFIRDENLLGLGEKGIYWSGTACSDGYKGFSLYLGEDNDIFSPYYEENKQYKVPVRLVMRK